MQKSYSYDAKVLLATIVSLWLSLRPVIIFCGGPGYYITVARRSDCAFRAICFKMLCAEDKNMDPTSIDLLQYVLFFYLFQKSNMTDNLFSIGSQYVAS